MENRIRSTKNHVAIDLLGTRVRKRVRVSRVLGGNPAQFAPSTPCQHLHRVLRNPVAGRPAVVAT